MVVGLNTGDSGAILGPIADSRALPDGARVTVMVYVFVVVPFCAVTTMVTVVVVPSASAIAADVVPDTNAVPFTVRVAFASVVTGFTVMVAVALGTLKV